MAVRMDSRIDYFGNTVNIAAKLQGLAEGQQIALSHSVFADHLAQLFLQEKGLVSQALVLEFPWDAPSVPAYRVDTSERRVKRRRSTDVVLTHYREEKKKHLRVVG